MDAVDWNAAVVQNIKDQTKQFLKSLKFKSIDYVPISAYDGDGISDLLTIIVKFSKESQEIQTVGAVSKTTPISSKEIVVKCRILHCDNIIAPGFTCVAHFHGEEHQVVITEIRGKPFLKTGDTSIVTLETKRPVLLDMERVILRKDTTTLGFGVVV